MPPLTDALLDRPLLSPALAGALGRTPLLPASRPEITRELEELLARPPRQRSKLWGIGTNLHCSNTSLFLPRRANRCAFEFS